MTHAESERRRRDDTRDRCSSRIWQLFDVDQRGMPFYDSFMNDPRFGRTPDSHRLHLILELRDE